ncbi:DUF1192 domain-containing protein [Microbaculum marinum]|uniref:DUF1192 domain-containing protein n=1 Tax=Microbaculum marinum TaxID=1764581 RepID=A0AAW9RK71_9HYPH
MFLDDDKPKRTPEHEIGMDLSVLSVNELKARIVLLKAEIERLEADIRSKASTRDAAEGLFSKS